MLRAAVALTAPLLAVGDRGNHFPEATVTNDPLAHVAAQPVNAGTPTVITLSGYAAAGQSLEFYIFSLPAEGGLYETSQNYRTDPNTQSSKNNPDQLQGKDLPFKVTDIQNRIVYIPPDTYTTGKPWGHFEHYVQIVGSTVKSDPPARVVLASGNGYVAFSDFSADSDEWTMSNNGAAELEYVATSQSLVNRYIYGQEHMMFYEQSGNSNVDTVTWYFEAPAEFTTPSLLAAYGGAIEFELLVKYGSLDQLNDAPMAILECQSCDSGNGMRLVHMLTSNTVAGTSTTISIPIVHTSWQRDPLNDVYPYQAVTEAELASVLHGVTRLAILGDLTPAKEGIAIDNVRVTMAATQPAVPMGFLSGCPCRHNSVAHRHTCCAEDPEL